MHGRQTFAPVLGELLVGELLIPASLCGSRSVRGSLPSSCKPITEASECPHAQVGTPCGSVQQEETMMVEIT